MRSVVLSLQLACDIVHNLPTKVDFLRWLCGVVLPLCHNDIEINIRLVNEAESRRLNLTYCGKDWPTNVLSFSFTALPVVALPLLGDIVICRQIVEYEAQQQKKVLKSHWAHMVVHGSLHLLGYNHHQSKEALEMESLETKIMKKLGFQDPYLMEKECE